MYKIIGVIFFYLQEGLMQTGLVTDVDLAEKMSSDYKGQPIIYWKGVKDDDANADSERIHKISGSDTKEIVENILSVLPNPEVLDEEAFKEIRTALRSGSDKPWLICFYLGAATELNLQLKRLPTLVPGINIGKS